MKRSMILVLVCCAVATGFPIFALGQTPPVDRGVLNWAYGEGMVQSIPPTSTPATSTQTYGYLYARESYDVKGVYDDTYVYVHESVMPTYGAYPHGDRFLQCPVDRKSLTANPNKASVSAVLDAGSSSCDTFGFYCAGPSTCGPWIYSGQIGVSGDWHDSRFTTKGTQNYQSADNLLGTSYKSTCQYASGDQSKGGFSIGPNTYVFGSPNTVGRFQSNSCNYNAK